MKEKLKKVKGIIILLLLMVLSANSHLLMSIATDDNLQERELHATAKIETSLEKYINYDIDGQKGELVQLGLDTSIEYETEEDQIPLQATGILLNVPQIENDFPQSVKLIAKSTMLTNGSKNGKDYKYEYDKENGQIKIIMYNKKDENGNIYSQIKENAKDSLSVILDYGESAYNSENIERNLKFDGQLIELAANNQNTKFKANFEPEYTVSENQSSVISNNIKSNKVYNGYIKSNIANGTNYATKYSEVFELNISKEQISDEIQIDFKNAFEKNESAIETDQVIYTSSEVNKEETFKILGENGYIKALDQEGNVIGEITNQTEADSNGICKINYTENQGKLTLVVSKPETVGNIKIQNNKQILSTMKDLNVEKIVQEDEIKCINKVEEQVEETNQKEIYSCKPADSIELRDSSTKVKLNVNQTEWTNEKQNELEFELELCNNKAKYNLFSNFEATIQLPEETEKVILDKEKLMYANGLEVENISYNQETKQITVKLAGTQTKYVSETLEKGTTLTIPAIVILQNNIEEKEIDLTATYKNYNTFAKAQETGTATEKITLDNFTQELTSNNQNTDNQAQPLMRSSATLMSAPTTLGTTGTLQTAEGIELEVKAIRGDVEITEENPTVYEGEFIKYEITAKNTTSNKIDDVKIVATLPEGVKYGELVREDHEPGVESYYDFTKQLGTIELGSIEAGKTQSTYFEVQVNDLAEGENQKQITTGIKAFIGNALADECTLTHVVKDAEYKVFLGGKIFLESEYKYILKIEGESSENVDVNVKLPSCMKATEICSYNSTEEYYKKLNEETEINVELKPGEYLIYANIDLNDINKNNNCCTEVKAVATVNNKYKSNENRLLIEYYQFEITMDSENKGTKVKEGEEINYEIKITLKGKLNYSNNDIFYKYAKLVDFLPEGVEPISMVYNNFEINEEYNSEDENSPKYIEKKDITEDISGKTYGENGQEAQVDIKDLLIPTGETITVYVKTAANRLIEQTEINNMATVSEVKLFELQELTSSITQSNIVSHIILPYDYEENNTDGFNNTDEPVEPENPSDFETLEEPEDTSNENKENKYSISGYVWNDQNSDGKKQENEQTLSGIQTYLVDTDGNVKNIATSGKDGSYTFSDIKEGNYIVVFRYNTDKYNITKYQVNGVSEELNSNAQKQNITIQGEEFVAGVSNEIALNKDISNINLGLIESENQKFDIKVESFINKVTVKTANDTRENTYDNATLVKTEVKAKEVEGATVEVEYKIVITNNGDIAGTINSIVDTLPEGFSFNNTTNSNWNINNDGTVVNTSLSNEKLEVGKSKEISLILTKELTENSTGTYTNVVKLEGLNNSLNSEEINSANNTSKTEFIVSISTGMAVYIIIDILIITVLLIILNIKFNIFSKLKFRFMVAIFAIGLTAYMCSTINPVKAESMADEYRRTGHLTRHFYLTAIEFGSIGPVDWGNGKQYSTRYRWDESYSNELHRCIIINWKDPLNSLVLDGDYKVKPGYHLGYTDREQIEKRLHILSESGEILFSVDLSSWSDESWNHVKNNAIANSNLASNPKVFYFERDWRSFLSTEDYPLIHRYNNIYDIDGGGPSSWSGIKGICLDYDANGGNSSILINNISWKYDLLVQQGEYYSNVNAYYPLEYTWNGKIDGSGTCNITKQDVEYTLKGNTGTQINIKAKDDVYVMGPFRITDNYITYPNGNKDCNYDYTFSIKLKNGGEIGTDYITACRDEDGGREYTKFEVPYTETGNKYVSHIAKNTNFYLKIDKGRIGNSRWYCICNCI